jgi:hypothetical protein
MHMMVRERPIRYPRNCAPVLGHLERADRYSSDLAQATEPGSTPAPEMHQREKGALTGGIWGL